MKKIFYFIVCVVMSVISINVNAETISNGTWVTENICTYHGTEYQIHCEKNYVWVGFDNAYKIKEGSECKIKYRKGNKTITKTFLFEKRKKINTIVFMDSNEVNKIMTTRNAKMSFTLENGKEFTISVEKKLN